MKNEILTIWQKIYYEWFGMEIDISDFQIPETYNPEKHFLVLVAKEISISAVVLAIEKRFNIYLCAEGLDTSMKSDRSPQYGSYLILFNCNIEIEQGLSAKDLVKKGHKGITLLERLLLEILHYSKTKQHLDIDNWILCFGSCDYEGFIPILRWDSVDNCLDFAWEIFDNPHSVLCSRFVVSFCWAS